MPKNKINYMKLTENIKLNDGTKIDKGTSVRMNYKEGPFYNVELNENNNVKKIFWITEGQGKISISRNITFNKKEIEEHLKDLKETWFENSDSNKKIFVDSMNRVETIGISENKTISIKKRGRPKKIK